MDSCICYPWPRAQNLGDSSKSLTLFTKYSNNKGLNLKRVWYYAPTHNSLAMNIHRHPRLKDFRKDFEENGETNYTNPRKFSSKQNSSK